MSKEEISLSLAGAYSHIEQYRKKHWFRKIDANEDRFLTDLQNRIRAIQTAQTGWLKVGLTYRYYNDIIPYVIAGDISKEMIQAQIKMLGFTQITVRQLFKDTLREMIPPHTHETDFLILLDFLANSFKQTWEEVETLNTFPVENYLVTELEGAYFPFAQNRDPLRGRQLKDKEIKPSQGFCNGYVKAWGDEIAEKGYASFIPRLNNTVFHHQHHLRFEDWKEMYFSAAAINISSQTDFRLATKKIIKQLKPQYTYKLILDPNSDDKITHATGIRLIPKSKPTDKTLYEFFDPNLGIVMFDDEEKFSTWLAYYLSYDCFSMLVNNDHIVKAQLFLHKLNKQPTVSKASVPPFIYIKPPRPRSKPLTFTLADTAQQNNIQLKDPSFLERYKFNLFLGGYTGFTAGFTIGFIILASASFAVISITTLGIAAGVLAISIALGIGIAAYIAKKNQLSTADSYASCRLFTSPKIPKPHSESPIQSHTPQFAM